MKTIGLLGGMSWESTLSYYKLINQGINRELGGLHSAKICLNSVDFAEIEQLQHQGKWQQTADILTAVAQSVEAAGADCLLICTNTMHKLAPQISAAINIPLIHIADATAQQLIKDGVTRVGLLGTQFTMAEDFYKGRLREQFDIEVLIPDELAQQVVHKIIYTELCQGIICPESRQQYVEIIEKLHQQGAQAVILGCTEIALLVQQEHTSVPLYDTTAIHGQSAVNFALEDHYKATDKCG
ncbi:aspartate/glutamate racemase family protein [Shewanella sp. SR44-3]|uniref:aspartate/glutamate racemase family protein n=1 Tax=Shewanella sp. SR44-3 TaxID=2760936 RepID=UPI0015F9B416|nr:aspartate/glutamate racemase family protein [Shewanella sp. SR44-3]MBB1270226.1 aspartate/glutamate racemase family protein [Shewanella sp. SR44-3]